MKITSESYPSWPGYPAKTRQAPDATPRAATASAADAGKEDRDVLELSETGEEQDGPDPAATAVPDEPAGGTGPASCSGVKALTYGILGLDCPDRPKVEPENTPYTTGQWVGAAGKMAAIFKFLL